MGLKFVGKGSVVVDCRTAQRNGKRWTLVDNRTMIYCQIGEDVVEKLLGDCSSVQELIDKLRKAAEKEKKNDEGYSERVCFVSIEDAPSFLNLLDASDHVKAWNATPDVSLSRGERAIFRIDYTADRQLLFQEGGKVVFRDEGD